MIHKHPDITWLQVWCHGRRPGSGSGTYKCWWKDWEESFLKKKGIVGRWDCL
ncbi:hypothetical protein NC651_014239 [Populus alba x Populus x berolinensis]|nr:hypothetical protein NC651_014239 [Populus alba x Populus x berolinensis]